MNPALDELAKLEASMSLRPWGVWKSRFKGNCVTDGAGGVFIEDIHPLDDAAGIAALRNAAPTLIMCAHLLRAIINDSGAVIPDDYMSEARAALARLERP